MRPCSLFLVTDLDSLLFWTSAQKKPFRFACLYQYVKDPTRLTGASGE